MGKMKVHELAKEFDPINFDADKIVKFAIDMGMKYLVITTKHHEGFCLFDSKVDDYNSMKIKRKFQNFKI